MTASNHIAAGAVIGFSLGNPVLAVPLAFASHFVLDAVPHFGYPGNRGYQEVFKDKHKFSIVVRTLDLIIAAGLLVLLANTNLAVLAAAVIALSPDFMWPLRYFFFESKGKKPPGGPITRFHARIQRYERPWGLFIELAFFGAMISLIYPQI